MNTRLKATLRPEAAGLQELGNELIARSDFTEATLGQWSTGPKLGFSNGTEQPTTILTAPLPWLPDGDAKRLVEVSGLEYPIFSIASMALAGADQPLTIVSVSTGSTADQSLFADQGRCTVNVSTRRPNGRWSTTSRPQDGMNAEVGVGFGPVDVLGLLERIRQAI